ncbi:hypothetical protein GCM10022267_90990 [Lentzea roselyniae]|uniref:Uncharacterized protein n=1 Tax=Lentzea roselyniae TaxID=531940 RepID=A0ABP7CJN2_9PSEU
MRLPAEQMVGPHLASGIRNAAAEALDPLWTDVVQRGHARGAGIVEVADLIERKGCTSDMGVPADVVGVHSQNTWSTSVVSWGSPTVAQSTSGCTTG